MHVWIKTYGVLVFSFIYMLIISEDKEPKKKKLKIILSLLEYYNASECMSNYCNWAALIFSTFQMTAFHFL